MSPESTVPTSAGTPEPAAPATPAAPEPASAGDASPVNWDDVSKDDDGEGREAPVEGGEKPPAEPAPAATPAEPKPAAQPPAQPPAEPAPAAAAPAAAPAAPAPAPATTPASVAPAAPPAPAPVPAETADQKAAREKAEREASEKADKEQFDSLVKVYNLPEDMQTKLQTEPEQVLPYLAARVHQQIVSDVARMLNTQLPSMVRTVSETARRNEEAKNAFYSAWPVLKPDQHEAAVHQAGLMFRQLNPNADAATAIKTIGKMVCDTLGIQIPLEQGGQPPVPAAPKPAAQPFKPAGSGAAPGGAPPASDNVFTAMADDMERDSG